MTTLVADPDIVSDAVARLTDDYRDKPVMRALAETLAERFAAEDEVELELYTQQWIDNAEGELLDAIGEIVGEPRLGRDDDKYRLHLRARVLINRSNGKISDTTKIAKLILNPEAVFLYVPEPPAAYVVRVTDMTVDASDVVGILRQVTPAGVGFRLEYSEDTTTAFMFAPDDTPEQIDADHGFADNAQTTGGEFADAVE